MNRFTIKELERFSGIKAHTIRIWEKRYGLLEPERTEANIRYYSDEDLRRLLNISFLNRHGVKISKIASLTDDAIYTAIKEQEIEGSYELYIDHFLMAAMQFSVEAFQDEFQQCEHKFGFHKTITEVIYPLMKRIGTLWGIREISPAHEHFISNMVRLRLMHAIQEINIITTDRPKILLFLHQNEAHDIGLLFAWYLLQFEGYPVLFLGSNVPYEGLCQAIEEYDPKFLFTIFTSVMPSNELENTLRQVKELVPNSDLFYALGYELEPKNMQMPNVYLLKDAWDLIERIQ